MGTDCRRSRWSIKPGYQKHVRVQAKSTIVTVEQWADGDICDGYLPSYQSDDSAFPHYIAPSVLGRNIFTINRVLRIIEESCSGKKEQQKAQRPNGEGAKGPSRFWSNKRLQPKYGPSHRTCTTVRASLAIPGRQSSTRNYSAAGRSVV